MDTIKITSPIDVSKVNSVYSGKPGCACGCNGKYFYASKFQEKSSEMRGYPVADDEVNDKMVARIVKMFNKVIADGIEEVFQYSEYPDFYVFDKSDSRTYTVYMRG